MNKIRGATRVQAASLLVNVGIVGAWQLGRKTPATVGSINGGYDRPGAPVARGVVVAQFSRIEPRLRLHQRRLQRAILVRQNAIEVPKGYSFKPKGGRLLKMSAPPSEASSSGG